jgi:uncharacterized protein YkwD
MMRVRTQLAMACALLLAGCMIAPAPPIAAGAGGAGGAVGAGGAAGDAVTADAQIAREIVQQANAARAREGLHAMAYSDGANRAAMKYAQELALRHEISHTSQVSGRETAGARLLAEGVNWTRAGENLAEFSPRIGIAENAIQGWLDSPPHRHNLLNAEYNATGAGVARDEQGNYYVVQLYVTLR